MTTPLTVKELSAMGNKARWQSTTPEQRKAAVAKANRARKASAKAARLAKSK
jgi:hypothetical protein